MHRVILSSTQVRSLVYGVAGNNIYTPLTAVMTPCTNAKSLTGAPGVIVPTFHMSFPPGLDLAFFVSLALLTNEVPFQEPAYRGILVRNFPRTLASDNARKSRCSGNPKISLTTILVYQCNQSWCFLGWWAKQTYFGNDSLSLDGFP